KAGPIQIRNTLTGEVVREVFSDEAGRESFELSPDGRWLFRSHWDDGKQSLLLIDVESGREVRLPVGDLPDRPQRIPNSFSQDGRWLAYPRRHEDQDIIDVWDLDHGQSVSTVPHSTFPAALSADGQLLAACREGDEGRSVNVWRLPEA